MGSIISQTTIVQFKIKSMTRPDKYYTTSKIDNGLVCSCPDNEFHKSNYKHIHVILDIIKQNKGCNDNEFKNFGVNKNKFLQILSHL